MSVDPYLARRERLLALLDEGVVVVEGGTVSRGNSGMEHPFAQRPALSWLTGFPEPQAVLVLRKSRDGAVSSALFVQPKDPKAEMWTGIRLGPDLARERFCVDEAFPLTDLDTKLPELLKGYANLYCELFDESPFQRKLLGWCNRRMGAKDLDSIVPQSLHNLAWLLAPLRYRKDADELDAIRRAAAISEAAYRDVMAFCAPGRNEADLATLLEYRFRDNGGGGQAYGSIVAGGDHANVLHYVANNAPLRDGELVLIDAAAQWGGYASDVTRTFPINGRFNPLQRDVYEIVFAALETGLGLSQPGGTIDEIHAAGMRVLAEGLIELGVLEESLDRVLEEKLADRFCPYSLSHSLGLSVHDPTPRMADDGSLLRLAPGMVYTIEPGLYFPTTDESVPERLRGLGIRIEDDVLITADGHENLTAGIARTADDVEAWCG